MVLKWLFIKIAPWLPNYLNLFVMENLGENWLQVVSEWWGGGKRRKIVVEIGNLPIDQIAIPINEVGDIFHQIKYSKNKATSRRVSKMSKKPLYPVFPVIEILLKAFSWSRDHHVCFIVHLPLSLWKTLRLVWFWSSPPFRWLVIDLIDFLVLIRIIWRFAVSISPLYRVVSCAFNVRILLLWWCCSSDIEIGSH